jgi:hypothetical protein
VKEEEEEEEEEEEVSWVKVGWLLRRLLATAAHFKAKQRSFTAAYGPW